MRVLFLDSPAFAKEDMISAMADSGIHVERFFHADYRERISSSYEDSFAHVVSSAAYDFIFSFNFYPILANCCKKHNLKYVSYVYDSPLVALYSYTITYPTNYVFIFDRAQYETLKQGGIDTVYYLPLAANPSRLLSTAMNPQILPSELKAEISFVGSLYNEDHHLYERLTANISPHIKGYLEGIINAQSLIYGAFFLEDLLTPNIISELQKSVPYEPNKDGIESAAYVYANYFLARKLAELDRTRILSCLSEKYQVKLYTNNPTPQLQHVQNMGSIDYYTIMPLVFRNSRINLNISLRSIQSGIPLRAFDIMGSGGFLLSNFQADFLDLFTAGEDYVSYTSIDEASTLCHYYLSHEKERQQIAANALGKISDAHTFSHRLETILSIIH